MNTKLILILITLLIIVSVVSGDPQVLTYSKGYWYNDHNDIINTGLVNSYYTVSNFSPWSIYVTSPIFQNSTSIKLENEVATLMKIINLQQAQLDSQEILLGKICAKNATLCK